MRFSRGIGGFRADPEHERMAATTSIVLIVNPVSGPRRRHAAWRARHLEAAGEALAARGVSLVVSLTEAAGHAEHLARAAAARGVERVVAWGGDGTVNEVARGLVGTPSALGIVPVGSGNGLARAVGIPLDPVDAVVLAACGEARPLDAGRVDDRWFFNMAGIGFDARVARVFNAAGPGPRGFLSYVRVTLGELWHDRGTAFRLAVDGRSHTFDGLMIAIANSREYGNGARIAPGALVDDGWLDVVAVASRGPLANVWRARRLFDGSVARDPYVWTARGRRIEVWHDGAMLYHVDGDAYEGRDRLGIEIVPGVLRLVRPLGGPGAPDAPDAAGARGRIGRPPQPDQGGAP